jgi:Protein of unknown function (DUF3307)
MVDKLYLLLIALAVLAAKHTVFDFFLQSLSQIRNKRIYGHPDGLLHAAGHAAGSCLAFFVITPPFAMAISIVVAEFALHYHIDWLKEKLVYDLKFQPDQKIFWCAFGIDQGLHQITYVGIVGVLMAA